jgi:hypothetical protein
MFHAYLIKSQLSESDLEEEVAGNRCHVDLLVSLPLRGVTRSTDEGRVGVEVD